jgi:hypothetical protein
MTSVSPFPQHPYLRLVPREPQPRRRLAVQINVRDGPLGIRQEPRLPSHA